MMNMQNYALDIIKSDTVFENVGDAFSYGISASLFGMAVVFGVLILIWGFLSLFKVFFYTIPTATKNRASDVKSSVDSTVISDSGNIQASAVLVRDDSASVVAAIVAAISAFRSQNGENSAFRVVSFKKRK